MLHGAKASTFILSPGGRRILLSSLAKPSNEKSWVYHIVLTHLVLFTHLVFQVFGSFEISANRGGSTSKNNVVHISSKNTKNDAMCQTRKVKFCFLGFCLNEFGRLYIF